MSLRFARPPSETRKAGNLMRQRGTAAFVDARGNPEDFMARLQALRRNYLGA